VRELKPGLWHWEALHPEWDASYAWPQLVSSYAVDAGGRLLLFDPLAVPSEIVERAAGRETAIVLTAPWHERDTRRLVTQLGAPVFVPPPDTAEDLIQKFGITPAQAGDGSPDVKWLLSGDEGEARLYGAGDRLPIGVEAFPGRERNDLVLWVESARAVISGDTLVDFGKGFDIADWLRAGVTREQVAEGVRPLLSFPVEHVLPTHGAPTDRAALERALSR
jgi:glyoxylase-like metal-dependent hydrolase (beta-lactamase superfamily II)